MTRSSIALPLLSAGIGLGLASDAQAIIIRHDVSDEEYVVDDADYPALVDLFEPGDCIGTLIHATWLLTVAHCAEDMRESRPLTVAGVSHDIDEIMLHPQWNGWNDDVALIRFREPVEGVTPYDLYSCLLYTSPSPRDATLSRMPSSA